MEQKSSQTLEKKVFTWLLETQESGRYNMITEIWTPLVSEFSMTDHKILRELLFRYFDDYDKVQAKYGETQEEKEI